MGLVKLALAVGDFLRALALILRFLQIALVFGDVVASLGHFLVCSTLQRCIGAMRGHFRQGCLQSPDACGVVVLWA